MLLVHYPRCGTCQKAEKWLESRGIAYETRDIKKENPAEGDIKAWRKKSGLPLKKFFNTSGNSYKALGLKEKLADMSEDDQIKLLAADGMLVKRPILVADDFVLVGFREEEWEKRLGA
ncbi:MAG: arsenate reductase family protein [Synergistaceae bacterium]|jgi:arsenate reductase|nr:arsenate reductase family protein [Synergistaceae bacterium]